MRAPSPRSVSAAFALARWPNALIAAAGVVVGAWWAGWRDTSATLLAALCAVLLTAAANTWNDLADLEIDRFAHPARPLPSGAISRRDADRFGMAAATFAVICASAVSVALGVISVGVLTLMRLYSPMLKRTGLAGNLVVSVLASMPFVYGSYSSGHWRRGLSLLIIAVPLHFARELAKDLDDAHADRLTRRTMPIVAGIEPTRIAIFATLCAFAATFAFAVLPHVRSPWLFLVALIPVVLALGIASRRVLGGLPGSPAYFKAAMLCAMIALVASRS